MHADEFENWCEFFGVSGNLKKFTIGINLISEIVEEMIKEKIFDYMVKLFVRTMKEFIVLWWASL